MVSAKMVGARMRSDNPVIDRRPQTLPTVFIPGAWRVAEIQGIQNRLRMDTKTAGSTERDLRADLDDRRSKGMAEDDILAQAHGSTSGA